MVINLLKVGPEKNELKKREKHANDKFYIYLFVYMKLALLIFGITGFLMANTYYDGKYTAYIQNYQKHMKIAMFGFIGLSIYVFIRKHPSESKGLFTHAHNIIKYMPVDKGTSDLLTPFFDFTNARNSLNEMYNPNAPVQNNTPQMRRMMNSGGSSSKRSVSETKKKYVASQQGWKCAGCSSVLDATFEVDHKIDLQYGGNNQVTNLHALCRNCHGKKGMMNRIR